jgi:hypothetical protein
MSITEGQWNLLHSRRTAKAEAITANDAGIAVAGGKVLYGLDSAACRHLLVPVAGGEVVEDHESQGVQVGVRTLHHEGVTAVYADLACMKPRFNAEFAHIVDDMLDALASGAAPHSACRNSLEKWRDLLRTVRTDRLDERTAVGLFGELLLLRDLVAVSPTAVRYWTGPGGGRFDFSGSNAAIEVKTSTRRYGRLVEISGETQLDAPAGLTLYLSFVRIEQVPAGGSRLWDLHAAILNAGVSPGDMQEKLKQLDVDEAILRDDPRHFRLLETRLYRVDGTFPRIVRASFVGAELPAGTLRLRYMIDLSGEPPIPLDSDARYSVLRKVSLEGSHADPA